MKVTVPQPCDADWDKMTPEQQGRFCSTCQTCVVDFTVFTDKELVDYLKNARHKVCGNFTDKQLGRELKVDKPIPNLHVYKWAAGIALLAGVVKPLNAQVVDTVKTEWTEVDSSRMVYGRVMMNVDYLEDTVATDKRAKYVQFFVYSNKKNTKPYTGKLTIKFGADYFPQNNEVGFSAANSQGSYIIKVPDDLVGKNIYCTLINESGYSWSKMVYTADYAGDTTLTPYIMVNNEVGLTTSVGVYKRKYFSNRFSPWNKIFFWKKKKKVQYRTIGCPSF